MNNNTFPNTDAAIAFIESFTSTKRIIALSEMVAMSKGEIVVNGISNALKHGYNSDPLLWVDFILNCASSHFEQMQEELEGWIKINVVEPEEGDEIIETLVNQLESLRDSLTKQNLISKISDYNERLKNSEFKEKSALVVDDNIANDYECIIRMILGKFEECIDVLSERVEERTEELKIIDPARRGVPVKHKLRWNTNKKDYATFFEHLIDLKLIQTRTGADDPERIMEILKATIDPIAVPKSRVKKGSWMGFEMLIRKRVYIPERLVWTDSGQEFASYFGPLFENGTLFIDKSTGQEGRPKISSILQQIIFIEGAKDEDLANTSLVKYLKEHRK